VLGGAFPLATAAKEDEHLVDDAGGVPGARAGPFAEGDARLLPHQRLRVEHVRIEREVLKLAAGCVLLPAAHDDVALDQRHGVPSSGLGRLAAHFE
jgi:hypothetical protein